MRFDTYLPSGLLINYVKHFAISEAEVENTYKVLPDTGLVIGFQYKGKISLVDQEKETPLSASGLTGLHDTFRLFKNSPHTVPFWCTLKKVVLLFFSKNLCRNYSRKVFLWIILCCVPNC